MPKSQKTKIVATVGPSCKTREQLSELIEMGVDVFRLNFSHGTHADHLASIQNIHSLNTEKKTHVGILCDLQGPKLRVGVMPKDGLPIEPGQILTFVQGEEYRLAIGTADTIYMSYEFFAQDVKPGELVLLDDGNIRMRVLETNGVDAVKLVVEHGSILGSKKGVNLPDTKVSQPSLTDKDVVDLEFVLEHDVHWIALSFVRKAADLHDLRNRILEVSHKAKIISKIEKPEAMDDIEAIVAASDAVMVARGDLGVEMPIQQLPLSQKRIVTLCNQQAKPVIVATQMLESMTRSPMPTRAEVTDVANAVIDGADAVMLSGESASGDHPALVVKMMCSIIAEIENNSNLAYNREHLPNQNSEHFISDTVCHIAHNLAKELNAKMIIGLTVSGYTAYQVSSYRPKAGIAIFSPHKNILCQLNLVWGVRGFSYKAFSTSTEQTMIDVHNILKNKGLVENGDLVVNTAATPLDARLRTNMVRAGLIE
jgi:pyruvate kinase